MELYELGSAAMAGVSILGALVHAACWLAVGIVGWRLPGPSRPWFIATGLVGVGFALLMPVLYNVVSALVITRLPSDAITLYYAVQNSIAVMIGLLPWVVLVLALWRARPPLTDT